MPDITYYWWGNEKATFNALANVDLSQNKFDASVSGYASVKSKQLQCLHTSSYYQGAYSSSSALFEFTADLTNVSTIKVHSTADMPSGAVANLRVGFLTKSGTLQNTTTPFASADNNVQASIAYNGTISSLDVSSYSGTRYLDVGIACMCNVTTNAFKSNDVNAVWGE